MSSESREKATASFTLHPATEDSAITSNVHGESSTASVSTIHGEQVASDTQNEVETQQQEDPDDYASDSGFDSGSLLGDETDTLASSIMHYRQGLPVERYVQ